MRCVWLALAVLCGLPSGGFADAGLKPVFDEMPDLMACHRVTQEEWTSPTPLPGWDEQRLRAQFENPEAAGSFVGLAQQGFAALYLSRLAARQGKADEAADWLKKYEAKKRIVNDAHFDFKAGFYGNRDGKGRFVVERTLAGYWPMLAEMSDPGMKDALIAKLKDSAWFGKVADWHSDWLVAVKAMDAYGEYALARQLARRLVSKPIPDDSTAARLLVEDVIGIKGVDAVSMTVTCDFARDIEGRAGVLNCRVGAALCSIVATSEKIVVRSDGAFTLKANGRTYAVKAGDNVFVRDRRTEVKVSDFDTIQSALDSGAPRIVFDKAHSPFVSSATLWARSDSDIVFEDGAELVAARGAFHGLRETLLRIVGVTNVTLRGEGGRGVLRMRRDDYDAKKGAGTNAHGYVWSEWRHCLSVSDATGVRIENMLLAESGGDGVCFGLARDVVMKNCVCDRNYRQGLSIVGARDMLVEDCVFSNTKGTPPQSGVDIEPWKASEDVVNVVFRNCLSRDNAACGFEVYLRDMDDTSNPVSLLFDGCRTVGNAQGFFANSGYGRTNHYVKGEVKFRNCTAVTPGNMGFFVGNSTADSWTAVIENCVCDRAGGQWTQSDVTFWHEMDREPWLSGVRINGLEIHQAKDQPWLVYRGKGGVDDGRYPLDVTGHVTVHKVDGTVERITLTEAYMRQFKCTSTSKPKPKTVQ